MPNLTIHGGLTKLGMPHNAVLSILITQMLSKGSGSFQISKLAAMTGCDHDQIRASLEYLEANDYIDTAGADLSEAGSVELTGIQIQLHIEQKVLPMEAGIPPRKVSGIEEVLDGDELIRCEVIEQTDENDEPNGWWLLSVTTDAEPADESQGDEPGPNYLVREREFKSRDEAWAWWDEYKASNGFSPKDIAEDEPEQPVLEEVAEEFAEDTDDDFVEPEPEMVDEAGDDKPDEGKGRKRKSA